MPPPCDATASLPCWLDVDLDAIAANVRALRRWVGRATQIAAVVKAEAYGAGAAEVATTALGAGARWLAVARVHEAVQLRDAGIAAPILVMNRTDPVECEEAVARDITVTVDSAELGTRLASVAEARGTRATVHLKVDTGLHRFGVFPTSALKLADQLQELDCLDVQGLYTHFASADEPDLSYTLEQLRVFEQTSSWLSSRGHHFALRHAANSAGTLALPAAHFDMVRVGLCLYGTSPSGTLPPGLALQPALALRARIARISELAPGEGVGYGQTWHATRPTRVGLVTAGYADGISRRVSNRGTVLVHGRPAPIIGRVSMDQTTIDITAASEVHVGDTVTFFGEDSGSGLDLWQLANDAEGIPHDVLTGIGGRVARVYHSSHSGARATRLNGSLSLDRQLAYH